MTLEQDAEILELLDTPSLYPEVARKPREQREADLKDWLEKYGEVNKCYNLYGMDRADAQPCDDWLDIKTFSRQRWEVNSKFNPWGSKLNFDHTLITRNKLVFEMFMQYWCGAGSPNYIQNKGVFLKDGFYRLNGNGRRRMESADFTVWVNDQEPGARFVFKEVYGGRGKAIIIVQIEGGKLLVDGELKTPDEFKAEICAPNATWICQDYFKQHPVMEAFNPTSVNTLRIVTYNTGERAFVDDAAIRMGCPGALVDNAYSDGFYTNVDDSGRINESLFNFSHKSRTCPHPFADVIIPNMKECLDLCAELHTLTPELFTIGWDIAIDEAGNPVCVEANDGWALFVCQTAIGHAARKNWNENLAIRKAYYGLA